MSVNTMPGVLTPIVYPESDGQPLAENTKQLRWIVVFFGNLSALFRLRDDVFVAADLYWYPVEGSPQLRYAPDILVVFGRPKGDRSSYRQWEEGDIPVTVVFEILSPGNSYYEMSDKQVFYEDHGAEECYLFDPDHNRLHAFVRQGSVMVRQRFTTDFVSPRLGIRFDVSGPDLVVFKPDGKRFLTFEELTAAHENAVLRAKRLAELSRKARRQETSAEELAELERLEEEELSS